LNGIAARLSIGFPGSHIPPDFILCELFHLDPGDDRFRVGSMARRVQKAEAGYYPVLSPAQPKEHEACLFPTFRLSENQMVQHDNRVGPEDPVSS